MKILKIKFGSPLPVRILSLLVVLMMPFTVLRCKEKSSAAPKPGSDTLAASSIYNTMAHFVAGLPTAGRTDFSDWQQTPSWQKYAEHFDSAWNRLETSHLSAIDTWDATELKDRTANTRVVFYPFSGPDFLYGYTFFPNGSKYVLMGLEPIGEIPTAANIAQAHFDNFLVSFQHSVNTFFDSSFFKTIEMRQKLTKAELGGTLPILLLFVARTGHTVRDIKLIELDPKTGTIHETGFTRPDSLNKLSIPGVKILFSKANSDTVQELYYFSIDISDYSLKNKNGFVKFIKAQGNMNSFTKAASYLMHRNTFSIIRDLVLTQSTLFLEDDSGIPLKFFDTKTWDLYFYGTYSKPINLFAIRYQPDLRAIYEKNKDIKPLPFDISYRLRATKSNLMLAVKKNSNAGGR